MARSPLTAQPAAGPWSVTGVDPAARALARDLARRSKMTLGEWLNHFIVETSDGSAPRMEGVEEEGEGAERGVDKLLVRERFQPLGTAEPQGEPTSVDAEEPGPAMVGFSREEMDAKLAVTEARTDTKFALLNGRLGQIESKLDDVKSGQRSSFWGLAGLIGVGLAATLAAPALGSQMFSQEFSASAIADQAAVKAVAASKAAAEKAAAAPTATPPSSGSPR